MEEQCLDLTHDVVVRRTCGGMSGPWEEGH